MKYKRTKGFKEIMYNFHEASQNYWAIKIVDRINIFMQESKEFF